MKAFLVGIVSVASLVAASAAAPPRLADYPAQPTLKGKPAEPVLSTPRARMFRTQLRRQAAMGPNFAGHFRLALWGCGAGCGYVAVVDSLTGEVFMPELTFDTVSARPGRKACPHSSDFELTSELFIAQGEVGDKVGRHYFHWKDGSFRLVHFEPTCVDSDDF